MGAIESTEEIIEGLVLAIVIGGIYAGMWATLITYYGNSEVFAFGALVLGILGLVPVAFAYGVLKRTLQFMNKERDTVAPFFNREQ